VEEKTLNPLAVVSLVAGVLAIVGHVCCCCSTILGIPLILLELVAIITGFIANSQKEEGESEPLALAGIATGIFAILMNIAYAVLTFGAVGLSMVMGN
jgi:hypothetical protein